MTRRHPLLAVLVLGLLALFLASCADSGDPSEAIEAYLQALIEKDRDAFNNLVCAGYEAEAQVEFDSLGAVETSLRDLECERDGESGDYALVSCTGFIEVSYGGENTQDLDLSREPFRALEDDGEWLMCGYER
ncbi:MAG: hypothetical protein HC915_15170 [Anaerolineae bacterium]|nr:hypothetical protein [Anaerolineae bacterium]